MLIGISKDVLINKYGVKDFSKCRYDLEHSLDLYSERYAYGLILAGEFEHTERSNMKSDETLSVFSERARKTLSNTFCIDISEKDSY